MSIFKKEKKKQVEATKKTKVDNKKLDVEELEQVAGGVSLRDVKKVTTTDISDDTKSKI